MYQAFNWKFNRKSFEEHLKESGLNSYNYYYEVGSKNEEIDKEIVYSKLDNFLNEEGVINGSQVQDYFFPTLKKDIFISHSFSDRELALAISGYLKEVYDLETFIDSTVWGSMYKLLKTIDNQYCLEKNGYYSYEKRNYSTSHVHMMLSIALSQMIDESEVLFFLNTPNSITNDSVINDKTNSPWIYSEIAVAQIIRRRQPKRHYMEKTSGEIYMSEEALQIDYDLDFSDFLEITQSTLFNWYENKKENMKPKHSLDLLYDTYFTK